MKFSTCTLALALVGVLTPGAGAQNLTAVSTERLDLTVDFEVASDCSYMLILTFKHDVALPVPTDGSVCNPAELLIADDGLPWLAFREHYHEFSDEIKDATPFDHVSIDYQACGHPPVDVFTKPHYDFHVYMTDVESRVARSCELVPMAPNCNFIDVQETSAGQAFFVADITGDAVGHTTEADAAIPFSGIHSWNKVAQPATTAAWTEPFFITGGYNGALVFWEPMIPLEMVTGSENLFYEETVAFTGTVDPSLPTYYSVAYNATTGYTVVTISEAKARGCEATTEAPASAPSSGSTVGTVTGLAAAAAVSFFLGY
jgi:hypothetical protein